MFIKSLKTLLPKRIILIDIRNCSLGLNFEKKELSIPDTDCQQKLLKFAVIGMPNAGKSTFINYLMDRKVCPTSSKVHTTRKKSTAIFTERNSQIIFLDTPGLVTDRERKQYKLEKSFIKDSEACLQEADIIGVIHDVSTWHRNILDIKIINLLGKYIEKPSLLILNKVDTMKSKRKLLDVTRLVTENCLEGKPMSVYNKRMLDYNQHMSDNENEKKGWPYFTEVFMVSSLTGAGLPEVKEHLIKKAKPNKWLYPDSVWSDQTPENIILNSVKARLLNFLPQEIPYLLTPCIEFFETNEEGAINTVVLVKCPTARLGKLVAGVSNGRLRQIIECVQEDLQNTFQTFVRINIVMEITEHTDCKK